MKPKGSGIPMKISIAMATYNGARYIEEQIYSIAAQGRQPDELIVCDDASTDTTLELVGQFLRHAPFPVRLFRNEINIGSTKTFEKAIRACSGDIVFLCDQDDVWRGDKLEKMCDLFAADSACRAVISDARLTDSHGTFSGMTLWRQTGFDRRAAKRLAQGGAVGFRTLIKKNFVTGAVFAFRADMTEWVLPIPSNWVHDAWIGLILSAMGPIHSLPETLVDYRQHESNQIGVRPRPLLERLQDRSGLETGHARMSALLTYMKGSEWTCLKQLAPVVEEKRNHLGNRLNPAAELTPILLDFLNGRYRNYSNGTGSFAKDIFGRLAGPFHSRN